MIFNSPDHYQHELCVELLASFLRDYCNCDIRWAGWSLEKLRSDVAGWVIQSFQEADAIILIHSKGAYEKDLLVSTVKLHLYFNEPK